jgi:hypothetical protein
MHDTVASMGGSLASRALRALLDYLPNSYTEGSRVEVLDSWTDGESVICLVYRFSGTDLVLGYRRHVELDEELPTLESWVEEVANFDIGEPLGTVAGRMWLDPDGIHWWGAVPAPGTGEWVSLLDDEDDESTSGDVVGFKRFVGPPPE